MQEYNHVKRKRSNQIIQILDTLQEEPKEIISILRKNGGER